MKPRTVSMPMVSRPNPLVLGTRPVAIMQASTSMVSLCSLVLASIILIITGFSPGTPGMTSEAKTPVRKSIGRGLIRSLSARRAISLSKVGIISGRASMKVTSDPNAVYTSENSNPMYPDPTMATYSGTVSSFRAPSEVKTVLSSIVTPGGTMGIDPGARIMSFAVYTFPELVSFTSFGFPVRTPAPSMISTSRFFKEPSRPPLTLFAS
mmetsp:Transcript_20911/g.27491  ORF Transcript_20911/g.27491 Transcript_20911/m.27491 type:complete len:209 (-) Transcript_20911:550-1176(-)